MMTQCKNEAGLSNSTNRPNWNHSEKIGILSASFIWLSACQGCRILHSWNTAHALATYMKGSIWDKNNSQMQFPKNLFSYICIPLGILSSCSCGYFLLVRNTHIFIKPIQEHGPKHRFSVKMETPQSKATEGSLHLVTETEKGAPLEARPESRVFIELGQFWFFSFFFFF